MRPDNLEGQKFNRLTVISKASSNHHHITWLCVCECGNEVEVAGTNLKSGHVKSCGCLRSELSRKRKLSHNLSKSPLYEEWARIRRRCNNPNMACYKNYGGRGIKVCKEWDDAAEFINWSLANGYKQGLTLDRINNNKGYSPTNCRWVSRKIQANNKRNNRIICFNNETHTLAEWADILSLPYSSLKYRLNNWGVIKAFTTPIMKKYSHSKSKELKK